MLHLIYIYINCVFLIQSQSKETCASPKLTCFFPKVIHFFQFQLKWGSPKPGVSRLEWSNLGWFAGTPHLKKPPYNPNHSLRFVGL